MSWAMPSDMTTRLIISAIRDVHAYTSSFQEFTSEIEVVASDERGVSLDFTLNVPMPAGAIAAGRLSNKWGWPISAIDEFLFNDGDGNFLAVSPIDGQRFRFYLPYGAMSIRKAGQYVLTITAVLPSPDTGKPTKLGETEVRVALPTSPPWRKIEYLWPLISLSMAVVRADYSVVTAEIRPLKQFLVEEFQLSGEDLEGLRLAMKNRKLGDYQKLLTLIDLSLPMFDRRTLLDHLIKVASYDGPPNSLELEFLHQIASDSGFSRVDLARLLRKSHAKAIARL